MGKRAARALVVPAERRASSSASGQETRESRLKSQHPLVQPRYILLIGHPRKHPHGNAFTDCVLGCCSHRTRSSPRRRKGKGAPEHQTRRQHSRHPSMASASASLGRDQARSVRARSDRRTRVHGARWWLRRVRSRVRPPTPRAGRKALECGRPEASGTCARVSSDEVVDPGRT